MVEFAFLAMSTGSTIHWRMSSAESFDPTPSRGSAHALAGDRMAHLAFLGVVDLLALFDQSASCDRATRGVPTSATVSAAMNRPLVIPALASCLPFLRFLKRETYQ